jgi:glutamate formiminotransferase
VVVGELLDVAIAQEIGAAVADLADVGAASLDVDHHHGHHPRML